MLLSDKKPSPDTQTQTIPFFARFARWIERQVGRSSLQLVRHLAIGHRYWDEYRHVPNGVRNPEHSKPRHAGDAVEIGRIDPR